jgi:hypothetical protein
MTDQIPDLMTYDGRQWLIVGWRHAAPRLPTNAELGIRTISRSTANWSGRIDVFQVFRSRLYLHKVEAEIPEEDRCLVPRGARKEIRIVYEPVRHCGPDGVRTILQESRSDLFVYDDMLIHFTGSVILEHPIGDPWEIPSSLEPELDPIYRARLEFEAGRLVGSVVEEILDSGDDP